MLTRAAALSRRMDRELARRRAFDARDFHELVRRRRHRRRRRSAAPVRAPHVSAALARVAAPARGADPVGLQAAPPRCGNSTMSMAYAVDFVALIMAGPDLAMVVAAAGVLMQCTVRVKKRQPVYRTAFSVASVIIAVHVGGWVWGFLGGERAQRGAALRPRGAVVGRGHDLFRGQHDARGGRDCAVERRVRPARVEPRVLLERARLLPVGRGGGDGDPGHHPRRLHPAADRGVAALPLLPRLPDVGRPHRGRAPARPGTGRHDRDHAAGAGARHRVGSRAGRREGTARAHERAPQRHAADD